LRNTLSGLVFFITMKTQIPTIGFRDRREAGRVLASHFRKYAGRPNIVVLALPRGGVPVAYEVAKELGAPLDVFIVRKLGGAGL
jgi:putative phosphoribosyl transferase